MTIINKTLILIAFTFILKSHCYCQNSFKINFICNDTLKQNTFFYILRPLGKIPLQLTDKYPLTKNPIKKFDTLYSTKCDYLVNDTSTCIFTDGFGRESFIIPGDTLVLNFQKIKKPLKERKLNDGKGMNIFFNTFTYNGKNKFIYSLFDSLAFNTNLTIHQNEIYAKNTGDDFQRFFDTVTLVFKNRVKYTSHYCSKYKIPDNIKNLAISEIHSAYILNLINQFPLINKSLNYSNFPLAYLDTLANVVFDDPKLFFNSYYYPEAAFWYFNAFQKDITNKGFENKPFYNALTKITNKKCQNQRINEYLNVGYLSNRDLSDSTFFSLVSEFKRIFPKSAYQHYVDSIATLRKNEKVLTIDSALATPILDLSGNRKMFSEIIEPNEITLIDCWASWCNPCLIELPYSNELELKYKNKVKFVYLSLDKDKSKWIEKANTLKLKSNSYLLNMEFKSNFAKFFKISSIPRYLIFDKKGQIVNDDAPRPSHKIDFSKTIDALIDAK